MAISHTKFGYGAVVFVGAVLFAIGTPSQRGGTQSPAPVTIPSPTPVDVAVGNGVTLRSVNVELPTSDRTFPGGAAAEAITNNCTACHSPGMVLNQPALTAAHWQAEVDHMRTNFKAPVAIEDIPAIVAYLASTNGTK